MKRLLPLLFASSLVYSVSAQDPFSVDALQADIDLVLDAYQTLHPGLYRYLDSTALAEAETALRERL
ncbi:MAG: hypothetical protein AAFQ98_14800, partial [Bacteroidota bacterium]